MKIPENDPMRRLEGALQDIKGVNEGTKKDSTRADSSHSDKVDISGKAKYIQQLNRLISSLPDIRTDRVEEIQDQIAAGTFHVQAEKVAEKLVRSALLDKTL